MGPAVEAALTIAIARSELTRVSLGVNIVVGRGGGIILLVFIFTRCSGRIPYPPH